MSLITRDFESVLMGFDQAELEAHAGSIYGLWPDLRIAYVNPAYHAFAEANGGGAIAASWSLGADLMAAIPAALQEFYSHLYRRPIETGEPAGHLYECSSPTRFRRFHQRIYPLRGGQGLLVVNSLAVEKPHDDSGSPPITEAHTGADGLVRQCCQCRRIRDLRTEEKWDWVPQWVESPPENTSHGLCSICMDYYYPDPDA